MKAATQHPRQAAMVQNNNADAGSSLSKSIIKPH